MTTPNPENSNKEICTIRLMFPIVSDEQALAIKKKIGECIADVADAQMQFAIQSNRLQ